MILFYLIILINSCFAAEPCADSSTDCEWTYDNENKLLTITGSGAMKDYEPTTQPWYSYKDEITQVSLNGITHLGNYCFEGFKNLQSITLPSSLKTIGLKVFADCILLSEINVEEGNSDFKSIDNILFSPSESTIYYYPLGAQINSSYIIPLTIRVIEKSAFYQSKFEEITLKTRWQLTIAESAFESSLNLKKIVFPDTIRVIQTNAFSNMNEEFDLYYKSGSFPSCDSSFTDIERPFIHISQFSKFNSFCGITNLWRDGCNEYSTYCYWNYNEDTKTLNVEGISNSKQPWSNYSSEIEIINIDLIIIEASSFSNLINLKEVTFTDKLETISTIAFYNCTSLETITLPASLESISSLAFSKCSNLKTINVNENNIYFTSINGVLFTKDLSTLIKYPEGITSTSYSIPEGTTILKDYSISDNLYLKEVIIPSTLDTISSYTFKNSLLVSITIPSNIKTIQEGAFKGSIQLTTVTYLEIIEPEYCSTDAFNECDSLNSVIVPSNYLSSDFCGQKLSKTGEEISQIKTGICGETKETCNWEFNLETEKMIIKGNGKMDHYTKNERPWFNHWNITELIIEEGIQSIGNYSFYDYNLKKVSIPSSVSYIGDYAFAIAFWRESTKYNFEDVSYKGKEEPICGIDVFDHRFYFEVKVSYKYSSDSFCDGFVTKSKDKKKETLDRFITIGLPILLGVPGVILLTAGYLLLQFGLPMYCIKKQQKKKQQEEENQQPEHEITATDTRNREGDDIEIPMEDELNN